MVKVAHRRKYLFSIYTWMITLLLVITIAFAFVFYLNTERIVLANEQANNRKILSQIGFNIGYMSENITNLGKYLYTNPDVKLAMNKRIADSDIAVTNLLLNDIGSALIKANPFLHSIFVYNAPDKVCFSTYGGMISYTDSILEQMVKSGIPYPKLKPIYREFIDRNSAKSTHVFTYLLYDGTETDPYGLGAVAVNVSSDWVLGNVKYLSGLDAGSRDAVMIIDAEGNVISSLQNDTFIGIAQEMNDSFLQERGKSGLDFGFEEKTIEGIRYMLSYSYLENEGFYILKVQDYNSLYRFIEDFKSKVILLTGIFLLVSLLLAAPIAYRVYRPVNRLVGLMRREQGRQDGIHGDLDELSYIGEVYQESTRQLKAYSDRSLRADRVMQSTSLKRLLEDSTSITEEQYRVLRDEYGLELDFKAKNVICLARIDHYDELPQEPDGKDKDLYRFIVANVTSELLSREYACQSLDPGDRSACFILQAEDFDGRKIEDALRLSQESIYKYYKLPVSIAVSQSMEGIAGLSKLFASVREVLQYRFLKGEMSVIRYEDVRRNIENTSLPRTEAFERKLIESLRLGRSSDIARAIDSLMTAISGFSYNSIVLSLMHLVNAIHAHVDEINANRLDPLEFDSEQLNGLLQESAGIDEFKARLIELLDDLVSQNKGSGIVDRHRLQSQAVIDFIAKNYSDPALCKDLIATRLKISSRHLGRIFTEQTGMSIQARINETRLTKAVELMGSTNLNTFEILQKVGFDNESYFYSLFKKKYGTTPREYIAKMSIRKMK